MKMNGWMDGQFSLNEGGHRGVHTTDSTTMQHNKPINPLLLTPRYALTHSLLHCTHNRESRLTYYLLPLPLTERRLQGNIKGTGGVKAIQNAYRLRGARPGS